MCDEWMPQIKLSLTPEQFRQLPRNASYKYELINGAVYLTPRPKHYHALLDLHPIATDESVTVQPLRGEEVPGLAPLFSGAFRTTQPFGCLDDDTRREAARKVLERTRTGGDGPWLERASFVAREGERTVGAVFITLLPGGDPCDWDSYYWKEPPPADCTGQPHLTWIFVGPLHAGRGVGTALLAASVRVLLEMGHTQLWSTFILGNESSMLWHWRNGFRLQSYPGSIRRRLKS